MSVPPIPKDLMAQHSIQTFNIPISPDSPAPTRTIPINIVEPRSVTSDNLPLSTWASSLVLAGNLYKLDLARHLDSLREPLPPIEDYDDDDGDDGSKTPTASDPSTTATPSITLTEPSATTSTITATSPPRPSTPPSCTADGPIHPILELGAGTGLVGLTASLLLRAPYTTLSDLPDIVPGVAANIAVNAESLIKSECVVRAGQLDWRAPSSISYPLASASSTLPRALQTASGTRARLLFAADTVYDEAHPALLEGVVSAWLERGPSARFVICYPLRVAYLDYVRDLWQRLEALGLTAEFEGREQGTTATNGDDELLCEIVVWKWTEEGLRRQEAQAGQDAESASETTGPATEAPTIKVDDLTETLGNVKVDN